jgi:hypothetical protein
VFLSFGPLLHHDVDSREIRGQNGTQTFFCAPQSCRNVIRRTEAITLVAMCDKKREPLKLGTDGMYTIHTAHVRPLFCRLPQLEPDPFPHPLVTSNLVFTGAFARSSPRVRRSPERPALELCSSIAPTKFFETKILPLSDCASRINFPFSAKFKIPRDQGEGYPRRRGPRSLFGKLDRRHFLEDSVAPRIFPPCNLLSSSQRSALRANFPRITFI